jgi:hypothetical protein
MRTRAILLGAIVLMSACDHTPPVAPAAPPLSLKVRVDQGYFELGQCDSLHLTVTAVSAAGDTVPADSARWSSFDTLSAPISKTGLLYGRIASANDTAYVTVFAGGSTGLAKDSFAIFAECNDIGGVDVCNSCPPSASMSVRDLREVEKALPANRGGGM